MCHLTEPGQVETAPVAYHDLAECKAALRRSRCYTTQHDGEVPLAIKDGTPMDPLCDRNASQLHDNERTVPIVVPKVRSVPRAHSACCAMQAVCVWRVSAEAIDCSAAGHGTADLRLLPAQRTLAEPQALRKIAQVGWAGGGGQGRPGSCGYDKVATLHPAATLSCEVRFTRRTKHTPMR